MSHLTIPWVFEVPGEVGEIAIALNRQQLFPYLTSLTITGLLCFGNDQFVVHRIMALVPATLTTLSIQTEENPRGVFLRNLLTMVASRTLILHKLLFKGPAGGQQTYRTRQLDTYLPRALREALSRFPA